MQREVHIYNFSELGNYIEFDIYYQFNYTMKDIDDRLTFRAYVGSYYDYKSNYLGPINYNSIGDYLIVGGGIWDACEANIGDFVAIGFPYNVKERVNTGTPAYFYDIAVHLKRNASLVLVECIDTQTKNVLVE